MKKLILTSLASLLFSFTAYGQFDTVVDGKTTTTDQVGIGTTTLDGSNKLTVQGGVNIGGTAGSHLKVRIINGKSHTSTALDNLYLNWNNGKHVFVGNMNATTANKSNLFVSGKVGIGTTNPKTPLFIQSGNKFGLSLNASSSGWSTIGSNWGGGVKPTAGKASILQFTPDGTIWFRTNKNTTTTANGGWDTPLKMYTGGYVLVGSGDDNLLKDSNGSAITGYKLFVKDGILTEKVRVSLSTTADWADYVFEEDYELNEIEEVENFVKENKHLPNIPSAQEMVNKGLNVAEMDAKLLRQIEELWLHTIQTNKRNNDLEAQLEEVIKQNNELNKRLEKLEE